MERKSCSAPRYRCVCQALFVLVVVVAVGIVEGQQRVIVPTKQGLVQGFNADGINYFLGVPYAAPPTGKLRWKPPQSVTPWVGVREAVSYAPGCMQNLPKGVPPTFKTSEDCLYLNVYAPPAATNLPVMVWIYGGSFVEGSGAFYDGSSLVKIDGAQTGVVVVNMNYRLGTFGYLSLPELQNETADFATTGFYGVQDQRAALQWVRDNIANFGGNPDDVTLFGESAGAISTCLHVAAPRSRGLFKRVYLKAASVKYGPCPLQSNAFAAKVGCNRAGQTAEQFLSCLRNVDTETAFHALPDTTAWFPVVDGVELTKQPLDYLDAGEFDVKGLLIGNNRNEDSLFVCPQYANITTDQLVNLIMYYFTSTVGKQILQLYPLSSYSSPVAALVDIMSDAIFKCPSQYMADAVSKQGVSTYFYIFEHLPGWAVHEKCLGVSHSFELPFIYPSTLAAFDANYTLSRPEHELSQFMRDSWATFAKFNDPNVNGVKATWPRYQQATADYFILNTTLSSGSGLFGTRCTFWRQHPCQLGGDKCNP